MVGILMELPTVEKTKSDILMNRENQNVIVKMNSSKDNMKSLNHVKRRVKFVRTLKTLEL
jgi:hypothetical protein